MRRPALLVLVPLLVTALLGLAPPASAAAPWSSVTMHSEAGDYVGAGRSDLFDTGNASISATGSGSDLTVGVDGGTHGRYFTLTFAAPAGTPLAVGSYERAERTPFRAAGRPGIDISGDGRGCNQQAGRFEVRDLARDAAGRITRVHLLYEQHCEGGVPALFGEVRIAVPTGAGLVAESSSLTWPDTSPGASSSVVPITLRNRTSGGIAVSRVALQGPDAASFLVRADECTGVVVAAGDLCEVFLRFVPTAAGPRTATLAVTDAAGRVRRVQLDGHGTVGRTGWTMKGEAGDYISGGRSYAYSPADARLSFTGGRSGVFASVLGADGDDWSAQLVPADGDILAVGTYTGAHRYPFNGTGPGLSVSGNGRGCNTLTGSFTIKQISFSRVDGSLQRLLATFEQHCEGQTPALRGELAYRTAADVTAPAAVTGLTATPTAGGVSLSWRNPSTDWSRTVVRRLPGATAPGSPTTGLAAASGAVSTATVKSLQSGSRQAFAVWTVDAAGNVGPRAVITASAG